MYVQSGLAGLVALLLQAAAPPVENPEFRVPAGWQRGVENGFLMLAPEDMTERDAVVVIIFPVTALERVPFSTWFEHQMTSNLLEGTTVVSKGEAVSNRGGGAESLTTAWAVQDMAGAIRLLMFHAVSDGSRAAFAMGVAGGQPAVDRYSDSIRELFETLTLPGRTSSSALAAAATGKVATGGDLVPNAEIRNGRPQGLFVGVSMLSGNAVFLLFLEDGRVLHNMPRGGMNQLDWEVVRAEFPNQTGNWSVDGGVLIIRWVDGNVWSGPLESTPTGFQYQGKSYGAAKRLGLADLAGSWEGTVSTGWMNTGSLGPSTTSVSHLTVDSEGRFRMDSTAGSDVGPAVAQDSSNWGGTALVEGFDLVFQGDDGRVQRASLVGLTGGDIVLIDGRTYTGR